MILVILGTQDKPFTRLLDAIDKIDINQEVIIQKGHTKYASNKHQSFDFIDNDKFNELLDKADIIITHGGVGTIMQALKKDKKVIAVSRLSKFNEHQNDHQLEIIKNFTQKNYILDGTNLDNLLELINNISSFNPNKFISNNNNFINLINNYINNN